MATRAFYHPRQLIVDLGSTLEPWLYNEIAGWHGYTDKENPVLTCLGNNEPMTVWKNHLGRYFVRHFPHGNPDGHVHPVLSKMSDEHLRMCEYSLRAGIAAGHRADLEVSTGNGTRVDVCVYGPNGNVGLEIQRSHLTTPQATRRAGLSFEAGLPTGWISDRETDPQWADYVPTARLETRGGWDERVLAPNTAWVIIADYERERDASRPTGWGYRRTPRLVLMDDLAALMPAGEIVPAAVGTRGHVDLVFKSAVPIIESCTYPGATEWNPVRKPVVPQKEAVQRYSIDCHHGGTVDPVVAAQHSGQLPAPRGLFTSPTPTGPRCPECGTGRLYYPEAVQRGYCGVCRYTIEARRSAS